MIALFEVRLIAVLIRLVGYLRLGLRVCCARFFNISLDNSYNLLGLYSGNIILGVIIYRYLLILIKINIGFISASDFK